MSEFSNHVVHPGGRVEQVTVSEATWLDGYRVSRCASVLDGRWHDKDMAINSTQPRGSWTVGPCMMVCSCGRSRRTITVATTVKPGTVVLECLTCGDVVEVVGGG